MRNLFFDKGLENIPKERFKIECAACGTKRKFSIIEAEEYLMIKKGEEQLQIVRKEIVRKHSIQNVPEEPSISSIFVKMRLKNKYISLSQSPSKDNSYYIIYSVRNIHH